MTLFVIGYSFFSPPHQIAPQGEPCGHFHPNTKNRPSTSIFRNTAFNVSSVIPPQVILKTAMTTQTTVALGLLSCLLVSASDGLIDAGTD